MSKPDGKGLLAGVLIGAAAGYVAGLLTAPKSGKETRADIKRVSLQAKEELERRLMDAREDLSDAMEEALRRGKQLSGRAKDELNNLMDKGKQAQSKAKDVLHAVKSGEATDKDLEKALVEAKEAKKHILNFIKKEES